MWDILQAGTRGVIVMMLFATACSSPSEPDPVSLPTPAPAPAPAPAPPSPADPPPAPVSTARYRATFDSTWNAASHPIDFPATAHFSPLVGGTHSDRVRFWAEGQLASEGIRAMAEQGRTTPLDQEIGAAIANGTAEHVFTGGAIAQSPGSASAEFEISERFPLVTLVSMVAPSPDWFAGVSGIALFSAGRWIDQVRFELVPWDAGTDSGLTFTSPDSATVPRQPITRIVTAPLSPGGRVTPLATLTFQRLQ